MLEHVPAWLGRALSGVRAGADKLAITRPELRAEASIELRSPAFADGARLPPRFTADGDGISPPLVWSGAPEGAASLALLVEDPDAPAPQPFVHAVIWNLPPDAGRIGEGGIARSGEGDGRDVGRNTFFGEGWLPPDPPTGHGEHRYVFQLFALGPGAGDPGTNPGRSALVRAMAGRVLASGVLVATYSRGKPTEVGPVGAVATG